MKSKFIFLFSVFTILALPVLTQAADAAPQAKPKAFSFQASDTISNILLKNTGKSVEVLLKSGKSLSGTVEKVGNHTLHLKGLKGREFFDGLIQLNEISAVIIRVKAG